MCAAYGRRQTVNSEQWQQRQQEVPTLIALPTADWAGCELCASTVWRLEVVSPKTADALLQYM